MKKLIMPRDQDLVKKLWLKLLVADFQKHFVSTRYSMVAFKRSLLVLTPKNAFP